MSEKAKPSRKTSKKKPNKIEEMTKEQIRDAILKKRECNDKAQGIVESLLERNITEAYFLQCLPDINQSHLEDIIEERAIEHFCGYPVCSKTISDKDIPKQKYRISVKTNKVYDITARKSFCSNTCYKAAMYVKKQMLTSPLWFRDYEEIPKFHILPLDTVGSLGQEVDVSLIERISLKTKKQSFTSINEFTNASLNEMTGTEKSQEYNQQNTMETVKENKLEHTDITIIETQAKHKENILMEENIKPQRNSLKTDEKQNEILHPSFPKPVIKQPPNPLNIVGEIIEKPEKKIDPILVKIPEKISEVKKESNTKVLQKKQPSVKVITIEVEKSLAEWFTLDTILFLFGEDKVKELVENKGESIKEYLNNYASHISYSSHTYDQYQALCRKLNMLELEDRKNDVQTLQREMKPLPDYSILQEESKKMQLKVKAFFSGETEIPIIESEGCKDTTSPYDDGNVTQLPLVDKNAQNALRRRIVCQHLNKVLPDILRSLGLLALSISSDIRLLVNTFKLRANNIMFKPIQWMLIAIVFIKLLSLRDKRLEYLLAQQTAFQHMQLLLLSYKQDGEYLDRLISWLTDIDRLLDTNDMQLTVA